MNIDGPYKQQPNKRVGNFSLFVGGHGQKYWRHCPYLTPVMNHFHCRNIWRSEKRSLESAEAKHSYIKMKFDAHNVKQADTFLTSLTFYLSSNVASFKFARSVKVEKVK